MAALTMKEISAKLASELMDAITRAEEFSDAAYMLAKSGDAKQAQDKAMLASVAIFEARTHLQWHIDGYQYVDS